MHYDRVLLEVRELARHAALRLTPALQDWVRDALHNAAERTPEPVPTSLRAYVIEVLLRSTFVYQDIEADTRRRAARAPRGADFVRWAGAPRRPPVNRELAYITLLIGLRPQLATHGRYTAEEVVRREAQAIAEIRRRRPAT